MTLGVARRREGPCRQPSGRPSSASRIASGAPFVIELRGAVRPRHQDREAATLEVEGQLRELAVGGEVGRPALGREDGDVERVGEAGLEVAVEEREPERVGRVAARPRVAPARRTERPSVSVPVLSVQRTVMLPRFWMAGSRLTSTPRAARTRAPRLRLTVTMAGSSSGVRPTARAIAKSSDSMSGRPRATLMARTATTRRRMTRAMSSPKLAHAALEVVLRRSLDEPTSDEPVARVGTGGGEDRLRGPAHDARAEEHERVPVAFRSRVAVPIARDLERRRRLAGHRRLVDVEVVGLDEPAVRRDDVARVEHDEVAAHEVVRGDVLLGAIADDRRLQRQSGAQRGHRLLRAGLLDEAEGGRQDDDDQDDARVDRRRPRMTAMTHATMSSSTSGLASWPTRMARRVRPSALLDLVRTVGTQALGGGRRRSAHRRSRVRHAPHARVIHRRSPQPSGTVSSTRR